MQPTGTTYPDIYRLLAQHGAFYSLAGSGKTMYRIVSPVLQQLSKLPPSATEVTNYIWGELNTSSNGSLYSYSIEKGDLVVFTLKAYQITPAVIRIIISRNYEKVEEIDNIPFLKGRLYPHIKEYYSQYPWLDIRIIYYIFTQRLSCFRRDPYYNLKATFNYLKERLNISLPALVKSDFSSRMRIVGQLKTLSRLYMKIIGVPLAPRGTPVFIFDDQEWQGRVRWRLLTNEEVISQL